MVRKRVFALCMAIVLGLSLLACSRGGSFGEPSKQTLSVGAIGSIDVLPIVIAEEQGYFDGLGVDVRFENFKSAKDRDAAFQAGSLDGIICDQVAVCLYRNADMNIKITGVTDGDFMLVASSESGIKSVSDMVGKSSAISEKTAIEYTLDQILIENSISPGDIEKVMVPAVPGRLEMLRNNNVDTALMPEPFSTLALDSGAVLLGSASQLASYISVTVFTQDAIDSKGDGIKAFFKAYNQAVDYINNTPISEYEDIIIAAAGYPEEMRGKITLPKFRKNVLPPREELQSVIDWTREKGLLDKSLKPEDLTDNIGIE